jgi:DNA-binding beta-propeller fold protein YncE
MRVVQLSPSDNTVVNTINVGANPFGIVYDGTNIYVTNTGDDTVSKLLPQ